MCSYFTAYKMVFDSLICNKSIAHKYLLHIVNNSIQIYFALNDWWGDQRGLMRVDQIFNAKNWNWVLHFNWGEISVQANSTSANQWSHDYKMLLRLTWNQQNKRIANRTPKNPNQSKTVSLTGAHFSSSKFSPWMWN
jgi:hypothetical protein